MDTTYLHALAAAAKTHRAAYNTYMADVFASAGARAHTFTAQTSSPTDIFPATPPAVTVHPADSLAAWAATARF